ncbi:MAG: hypothetical protein WC492_01520 [Candidatus Micrarchaeia archaeon]|jgi:MtN3 and saliva related transmembrane protein
MELELVGILGMIFIILAWIPETLQNFREKGKNLNFAFVGLYFFGSAFLAYHALLLKDTVFLTLNTIATIIALFNGYLIFAYRKKVGKRKR